MDLDLDLPRFDDDDMILPNAAPFSAMAPQPATGAVIFNSSSEVPHERESSQSAEAPLQRKRRAARPLAADERQELHNFDLAQWKTDYSANMIEAKGAKQIHKAPALAKKNAAFWVFGAGIGGVGAGLGSSKLNSPLDMFAGDAIVEALTGIKASSVRQKRARDDEEDYGSDSEGRRVRQRDGDGEQGGRGQELILDDDGEMITLASDVRHGLTTIFGAFFQWLRMCRVPKWAVMLKHQWKTNRCHGMSALPWGLVKAPLRRAVALPVALAVFPRVPVHQALYLALEAQDLVHSIDAPVEYPAPVHLLGVAENVTAASSFHIMTMTTTS